MNFTATHTISESARQTADRLTRTKRLTLKVTSGEWPYGLLLAVAVARWLVPIRSPLWLDETFSYYQINGGLTQIWSRSQGWPCSAVYPYVLWLANAVGGSGPVMLRIPSFLAMVGAVYFLFRVAEKFFGREVACLAVIIFSLHPSVAFAAIDARAYSFAVLMLTAATFVLVNWVEDFDYRHGVLFGVCCAGILYFQLTFGAVLPVFVMWIFIVRRHERDRKMRPLLAALASFVVAVLPLVSAMLPLFRNANHHSFATDPVPGDLLTTLAPAGISGLVLWTVLIAVMARRLSNSETLDFKGASLCFSMALIPVLILYETAACTAMEVFLSRYTLAAVPAIAMCWAVPLKFVDSALFRKLAGAVLVVSMSLATFKGTPAHGESWKDALEMAARMTKVDNAPVMICSDYVESNFQPMPDVPATQNAYISQVSYYALRAPIIPLPRQLNAYAQQVIDEFAARATARKQRFVVLAYRASYPTLLWIMTRTRQHYKATVIGQYDGVFVAEFNPL